MGFLQVENLIILKNYYSQDNRIETDYSIRCTSTSSANLLFFFLTTLLGISDKYLNKTKVHNK